MIMLDLNALKTFVLVADSLNFTEVAHQRNTVQSAVSAQIRKLEQDVGGRLIERGRGQVMHLTPEGKAFAVYARRIITLSQEAVETVRTARSRRIIRLGTTVTLAMSVVPQVLSHFARDRKDVQIQIQCDRSDALLQRLDDGEIDVAFMLDQGRHQGRSFVCSQPLEWVCAPSFSLPEDEVLPLAFLTDGRDLRHYALTALDQAGRVGQVAHLSPHPIGVRAFVQAGLAVTVMPRVAVREPFQVASAGFNLPALSSIALGCYRADATSAPDVSALIDLLEASVL